MIDAINAPGFPFEWNYSISTLNLGPLWLGIAFVVIAIILYKNVGQENHPRASNIDRGVQSRGGKYWPSGPAPTRAPGSVHASPIYLHVVERDETSAVARPPGESREEIAKEMHCTSCGTAFNEVMNQLFTGKGKVYCCSCGQGFLTGPSTGRFQ